MKKALTFLFLLCSLGLSAQVLPEDSVTTSKDEAQKASASNERISWMLRCHLLEVIESEYDYICEDHSPHFVVAQRSNEYWKIDLDTGKESMIEYVIKEQKRDASEKKEKSSDASAKKVDDGSVE